MWHGINSNCNFKGGEFSSFSSNKSLPTTQKLGVFFFQQYYIVNSYAVYESGPFLQYCSLSIWFLLPNYGTLNLFWISSGWIWSIYQNYFEFWSCISKCLYFPSTWCHLLFINALAIPSFYLSMRNLNRTECTVGYALRFCSKKNPLW